MISNECLAALKSYRQADNEGVMVLVSREALDEAIATLTAAASGGSSAALPEAVAWVSSHALSRVERNGVEGGPVASMGFDEKLAAKSSEWQPLGLYTATQLRDAFKQGMAQAATSGGVDWRELYRFQTAMRYMDVNGTLTKKRALAMADAELVGLEHSALTAALKDGP